MSKVIEFCDEVIKAAENGYLDIYAHKLAQMLKVAIEQRDRNLWLLDGIGQVSHKYATDRDNAELDRIAEEK